MKLPKEMNLPKGMKLPKGIRFVEGPRKKKYTAILPNGRKVHFGHKDYQQYKDSVPIKLGGGIWSHLDHLDPKRRKNYQKRQQILQHVDHAIHFCVLIYLLQYLP